MHSLNLDKQLSISAIKGRQILDSRGYPALEIEMLLNSGDSVIASVPSGASCGTYEAFELRDTDSSKWAGKGLIKAIDNISILNKKLKGVSIFNFYSFDRYLRTLDGTENKSHLGANVLLALSIGALKAGAKFFKMPLYQYIGGVYGRKIPKILVNIINGGAHSNNRLNFQEFMLVPLASSSFIETVEKLCRVFQCLKDKLKIQNKSIALGDEGGFSPSLDSEEEALDLLVESIQDSGFTVNKDFSIALDIASNELYDAQSKKYIFKKSTGKEYSFQELLHFYEKLIQKYPICSIEDPFAEDDLDAWLSLKQSKLSAIQIVGDDLFVSSLKRFELYALKHSIANAILIKPNQIGTISETIEVFSLARENSYKTIVSHRSGETEESFISDLAVALNSDQFKLGSIARGERTAKYNRLIRIEELLNL